MSAARNVSVTFTAPATFQLSLQVLNSSTNVASVEYVGQSLLPCSAPGGGGIICVNAWPAGTTLTLRPVSVSSFSGWSGDCAGAGAAPPGGTNDCVLVMNQNHGATASFGTLTLVDSGTGATLVSRFELSGARAQVTLNGTLLAAPRPGVSTLSLRAADGENRLEAQLVEAGRAGTWTLELAGVPGFERGTLRVTAGEAVAVGPDSVVFRLSGRAGERVGFAFQKR